MPGLSPKLRRTALEVLGRDTLSKLTSKLDLAVEDRRSAAAHVDALVRSLKRRAPDSRDRAASGVDDRPGPPGGQQPAVGAGLAARHVHRLVDAHARVERQRLHGTGVHVEAQ